jgi:hypothetical protein
LLLEAAAAAAGVVLAAVALVLLSFDGIVVLETAASIGPDDDANAASLTMTTSKDADDSFMVYIGRVFEFVSVG